MMEQLTSNITFESWVPTSEILEATEESTAQVEIPISIIKFEPREKTPEVKILPKQDFWVADLGAHWEFNRREIYEQAVSHRCEYPSLCS